MNVYLLYPDRDSKIEEALPGEKEELVRDLGISPVFEIMGGGSDFIKTVVKSTLLSPLTKIEEIVYRQRILKDVIQNPDVVMRLYDLGDKARNAERKSRFGFFTHHLGGILYSAIELMRMLLDFLRELREIAEKEGGKFSSPGFVRFFNMVKEELTPDYFALIEDHLKRLEFRNGLLIMAELGKGNKGKGYTLCKPPEKRMGILNHIFSKGEPSYTFTIDERDESGERALSEIKERGINSVTNALAQSVEHVLWFFDTLKKELAFYIGALNLFKYIDEMGGPITYPIPLPQGELRYKLSALYNPSLSITLGKPPVKNDLEVEGKRLFVITGANGGEKSTFLRSIGTFHLMMQSGMFVCAERSEAPIQNGVFTHFRRKEDKEMESGKLDEELKRMERILTEVRAESLILFNESFSSTNEKEGSQIATQIISALIESRITVFFVTHMYKFAHDFYKEKRGDTMFLRAERKPSGLRTFKIISGAPETTGYTRDLVREGI